MLIIDASNLIAGRLASFAAKKALQGEAIEIINSEKAIITGKKKQILQHYKEKIERGDPHHGPFYPKAPERILRRIIRGMLPHKQARGRQAYKRVKCFNENPENKKSQNPEKLKKISIEKLKTLKYMTIGKLSKELK